MPSSGTLKDPQGSTSVRWLDQAYNPEERCWELRLGYGEWKWSRVEEANLVYSAYPSRLRSCVRCAPERNQYISEMCQERPLFRTCQRGGHLSLMLIYLVGCGRSSWWHSGSLLWHTGSSSHRLTRSTVCGISLTVPQPGIEPASPALEGRFLTTGPPGKSPDDHL